MKTILWGTTLKDCFFSLVAEMGFEPWHKLKKTGYLLHGGELVIIVPLFIYRSSLLRVAQYSADGGIDPTPLFVLLFNCLFFVYIVH